MAAPPRFELGLSEPNSDALPLRYGAKINWLEIL